MYLIPDYRNPLSKLTFSAMLVIALCVSQTPAFARPLDDVKSSGQMSVFVYDDYPPYSYKEDGKLKGIDVELGKMLADALGVNVSYLVRPADENVDDDLRINVWKGHYLDSRVADVMMHVPADPELGERNDLVKLAGAYYTEQVAVLVNTDRIATLDTFAPFAYEKIAVEVDTVSDFFLLNAFRGRLRDNVVHGLTFNDAAQKFISGDVPALMAPRAQLEWVAAQVDMPVAIKQPPMQGIVRSAWPIGLAVKANAADLGDALAAIVEDLAKQGKLASLFAQYGVSYEAPTR